MTDTFQVNPPEVILLDGLPLPHGQEVVPCCEECQTGQFVLEDFTCARSPLHAVRDLRTNKVIVIGGRGHCWHCGEQCDDDSFSHPACKTSYEEHLKDCRCLDILEKDKSRHFKECPKRAEHPEPSVARANSAELRVAELEAKNRLLVVALFGIRRNEPGSVAADAAGHALVAVGAMCAHCDEPVLGGLAVCYDHAKRGPDGQPTNPRGASIVAVVEAAQKMAKFVPITAENKDLYDAHWELNKAVAKYEKP